MLTLDSLPFVQAANYTHASRSYGDVRWIVLHSTEGQELGASAEGTASWFANPDSGGSAHVTVDADSGVRSVRDEDVAYGAPGANAAGLHIEQAGTAGQTHDEWRDPYSLMVVNNAAAIAAQWIIRGAAAPRLIGSAQLQAGERGICSHAAVSEAFPGGDHWDPGPNYPFPEFVNRLWDWINTLKSATVPPVPPPAPSSQEFQMDVRYPNLKMGTKGWPVAIAQGLVNVAADLRGWFPRVTVDDDFGSVTDSAVKQYQGHLGLPQTGVVDQATWRKLLAV